MKNTKVLIALAVIISVGGIVTSCMYLASKDRQRDYYAMQGVLEEVNYTVDKELYTDAVLFLCSSDKNNKEKISEAKEKFSSIIDSELLEILDSKADMAQSIHMENMDMESAYDNSSQYLDTDDESYPIYGDQLRIVRYGTKEESEESIKWFAELPENTVSSCSVYKDVLLFRVKNKVSGEKLIRLTLDDGKIVDYKIYLRGDQ